MKTNQLFSKSMLMATFLLVGLQTFNSCKGDDPIPTITDVINMEAASELKNTITQSATVAALPAAFKAEATAVAALVSDAKAEAIAAVDLTPVVATMKTDNVLSGDEVTKLKANDQATYNVVVNRLSKLPSFISQSEIDAVIAGMKSTPSLTDNLIKVVGSGEKMYTDDYYAGAVAFIKYKTDYTIPILEKLITLKGNGNKSASTVQSTVELTPEQKVLVGALITALANGEITSEQYEKQLEVIHSGGSGS